MYKLVNKINIMLINAYFFMLTFILRHTDQRYIIEITEDSIGFMHYNLYY